MLIEKIKLICEFINIYVLFTLRDIRKLKKSRIKHERFNYIMSNISFNKHIYIHVK